jgi:DNA-directed RNA polymerase subunit RPC12/RpoP
VDSARETQLRCSVCGAKKPLAKISGKYYCYECGSRLVRGHISMLLKELEKKGLAQVRA